MTRVLSFWNLERSSVVTKKGFTVTAIPILQMAGRHVTGTVVPKLEPSAHRYKERPGERTIRSAHR